MPKTPDVDDGATLPDAEAEHTSVGPAVGAPDDGIEEIPAEALGAKGDEAPSPAGRRVAPGEKVTLGAPPPAPTADKTHIGSVAAPPAPASADETAIAQSPLGAPPAPDDHQSTMIMDSPLAGGRSARRGRLVVVAGKAEGEHFDLTDGAVVVGRSRDADLCLMDIGASRRHAEIVVDAGGASVRDLDSGNGTRVNGEQVTEVELVDGDEIAIGDHVLRYEAPEAAGGALARVGGAGAGGTAVVAAPAVPSVASVRRARRNATTAAPGRKRLRLVAVGLGALVVVLVGLKLALGSGKPVTPPKPVVTRSTLAVKDFEAGLALFKRNAYPDALAKFQAASQEDPSLAKAQEYVKATRREMAAAASIKKGKALLAQGHYTEARAAFQAVPSASLRYGDAQAGLKQVAQAQGGQAAGQGQQALAAVRQRLDDLVAKVKAIPGGPGSAPAKRLVFEEALTALGGLGGSLAGPAKAFTHALAVAPDDAGAKAGEAALTRLRQDIADKQAWAKNLFVTWQTQTETRIRETHAQHVRRMLAPGIAQFGQGQFRQAATTFTQLAAGSTDRDVKRLASRKAAAIKRFLPAYSRGMAAPVNRPSPGALKALAIAFTQAQVVDPTSPVLQKVQNRLGDRYYLKGRVAYNAQRYPDAYQAWVRALHFDPHQRLAQKGLADLKALAKKLYLQAYVQKALNRSRAIANWKKVIQMTPATDSYHQKAEQRLQEMGAQ